MNTDKRVSADCPATWVARLIKRPFCTVFLSGALLLPALLRGDGGKLILSGESAGESIHLFADPFPIRAGQPCDLSVLVQRGDDPVLDGAVTLQIGDGGRAIQATHRSATDKLLFAAMITLTPAGKVRLTVTHERASISGWIDVADEPPPALSYWPYFAAIPLAIGLFGLNRSLKRRRQSPTSL